MWRTGLVTMVMSLVCLTGRSQTGEEITAIMRMTGAASVEELDADEVERLERMLSHPLRINLISSSKLKESGLFSHYQIVSLEDYRRRHGDVLSLTELASVDGFSEDFVRTLAPFVSLETSRPAGAVPMSSQATTHSLTARYGLRHNESLKTTYGVRYAVTAGERISGSIAMSKPSDAARPELLTGNICWHFKRRSASVVAGDFNARFGQGLALWNGMGIGGLAKPEGFRKRASAISPSSSFTGTYSFRGVAAEAVLGRFELSLMSALTGQGGLLPALNVTWMWKDGQAGITHYAQTGSDLRKVKDCKTSMDISLTAAGADIFAECTYDWLSSSAAALAGTVFPAGESLRMAAMLRYYPAAFNPSHSAAVRSSTRYTDEYAASLSVDLYAGEYVRIRGKEGFGSSVRMINGSLCLDAACFPVPKEKDEEYSCQFRIQSEIDLFPTGFIEMKLRLDERIRSWGPMFRTDLRLDCSWYGESLRTNLRVNVVKSLNYSLLSYMELCFKSRIADLYLRQGCFFADRWEDRIYAYERDVPGGFNVPAFYGRGVWTAVTGSIRFARWGRIYARAALTSFPFMKTKKPGRAELKLLLKIEL